jgi:GntR family transcriptional repressor for pyruvate dehydrogenase complex
MERAAVPKRYLVLAETLREAMDRGDYAPGQRLPSERDLVVRYGVSRPTVREAMICLEARGLIDIQQGSGAYVLEPGTSIERCETRELIEAVRDLLGRLEHAPPIDAGHMASGSVQSRAKHKR